MFHPLRTKTIIVGLVSISALGACSAPPAQVDSTSAASKFLPCVVSDSGGFNDRSFNQLGYEGVQDASKKLGTTFKQAQSKTANDYAPNIKSLIAQGCSVIVASGFNFVAPVKVAAEANPDVNFIMVDDGSITAPNVKPVVFNANEAGFLAGYAMASYSKSGVVGTYGGQKLPPVTIFMDGIAGGVKYYNEQKGKSVKLLGWDQSSQDGQFTNSFSDLNVSKAVAETMLSQNADVLAPIGGPIYQGAAAAINASGKPGALIGNDADIYETDQSGFKGLFLTSILKNLRPTVSSIIEDVSNNGKFDNHEFVGTLKNDGAGIAPFHDFESKVEATLQGELDVIRAGIISGKINAGSPAAFKAN